MVPDSLLSVFDEYELEVSAILVHLTTCLYYLFHAQVSVAEILKFNFQLEQFLMEVECRK